MMSVSHHHVVDVYLVNLGDNYISAFPVQSLLFIFVHLADWRRFYLSLKIVEQKIPYCSPPR